jgi:predicted nuclease with TOPRIM domain
MDAINIEELLKERDQLLKKNPELIKYQIEIDACLDNITEPIERTKALMKRLSQKVGEEFEPAKTRLGLLADQVARLETNY